LRLLLSLPAGGGGAASSVAGCQDPVQCRLGVTGRMVSVYSLPPPAPPTLSHIMAQVARSRAAGDEFECPLICCVMGPANSCWTYSDARNIGRYNSSRYDSIRYTQYQFRYDTDPI